MHMKHLMLEYGNEARLVNQFWKENIRSKIQGQTMRMRGLSPFYMQLHIYV